MATVKKAPRQRGLAIVEMALVLPLLFLLLFGLIEYGWLFFKYQQIAGAARHGCRIGVAQGKGNPEVQAAVLDLMTKAKLVPPYTVSDLAIEVNGAAGNVLIAPPGGTVTVRVTIPYTGTGGIELTGFPLPLPADLVGETSMVKEGAPLAPP
ncbi:MAG: TadE/TadG family type IV pilus assembly protein [Planctomycetota bacterium]|jgi:Flp pilus assembly protein TadG